MSALLLAAGLLLQDADAEIGQWIEELASDSADVRGAATKKLIDKGDAAVAPVKAALSTDDPEKKARLRVILSEIDAPACAQILVRAMKLKDIADDKERVKAEKDVWDQLEKILELCDKESGLSIAAQALTAAKKGNAPGDTLFGGNKDPSWVLGGARSEKRCGNQIIVADGDVDVRTAEACVILASGNVKISSARTCIVLARGDVDITRTLGGVVLAGGKLSGSLAWQAEVGALGGVDGVKLSGGAGLWGEGFEDPMETRGAEVKSRKVKLILRGLHAKP